MSISNILLNLCGKLMMFIMLSFPPNYKNTMHSVACVKHFILNVNK